MFKNYFKVALRNLIRNKTHSLINIAGLAVGMTVVLLIGGWIYDQCTYERYNPNYDRIAQVMVNYTVNGVTSTGPSTPVPLADELRKDYRNSFTRIARSWWTQSRVVAFGDKKLKQTGKFMEPEGPDLLALTMLKGTRSALSAPAAVLLSASAAKALFGDADPMGRTITIDGKMTAGVQGVYQDLPGNSQFSDVQFIGSWQLFADTHDFVRNSTSNWGYDIEEIYVQLADHVDEARLSANLTNSIMDHLPKNGDAAGYHPQVFLDPISRWHLYSPFTNDSNTSGLIQFVWLFAIIGVFVLLLACINFTNLSTARSERRSREVGIRKTIGSGRGQLIAQFFGESLLMSGIAFFLSVLLVWIVLPFFNELAGKPIGIAWASPWLWLSGAGFCILTALLVGSYPAFYLSSFRPVAVLKGTFRAGRRTVILRRTLVVLQFTISTILVIGTIVVFRQIGYAKDRPVGYDRAGLLSIAIVNPAVVRQLPTLREELMRSGAVAAVTEASATATEDGDFYAGYNWPEKDPATVGEFATVAVSPGYGATIGWTIKEGRDFSRDFGTDSAAVVLNEAAVAFMGLKHPLGEKITYWNGRKYTIIGVVKNVVMGSPYEPAAKTVYMPIDGVPEYTWLLARMKPGLAVSNALDRIRGVWQKTLPSALLDYQFVDEVYAKKFAAEQRIGQLAAAFSVLALFISGLGIFGMASFVAEQRTKEIGIRKVLGATIFQLWQLLSREFLWLVGLSFLIAMPMSFYGMHRWLQRYPYHSGIPWWIFATTAAGVLAITLLTISFQSVKAALANPVKSLKAE
jgi:putative ABC transport system permease protein